MPLTFVLSAFLLAEPPLVAPTEPLAPAEQQKLFKLPPGFRIELLAAEPTLRKPMNLAFDRHGRLLLTESAEYPFPAKDPALARDSVIALTDTDGDGVPDRPAKLLGGLNIPIGLCPLPDGALVFDIPRVRRWTGRDALAKPQALGGEIGRKDTHGMASSFTRGLDGWVYACHGFANESELRGSDGSAVKMQSGNTFRFRPDGSRVEQWTWGQVNPFGLCFDDLGNLYSADCHSRPATFLLRGGRYESFGKPHDGLGFAPDMMKHAHGSTGICGAVVYLAENFPPAYRRRLFLCNPVTGRINSDTLETRGGTVVAKEEPDFLSCGDPWFRPVDLKLGPDGALYIADFYNCIIGHYEVPLLHPRRDRTRGRIWRVSYAGPDAVPHAAPGDLAVLPAARIAELLGHANLAVRTAATHEAVDRLGASIAPLLVARLTNIPRAEDAAFRAHALWALERLGKLDATLVERFAADPDAAPRIHLLKALAERQDWSDLEPRIVRHALNDADGAVRRAAADALGRHPRAEQTALLVAHLRRVDPADAALVHTLRMALRDHLQTFPPVWPESADPADRQRIADACLGAAHPRAARYAFRTLQQTDGAWRDQELLRHAARWLDPAELGEPAQWIAERAKAADAAVVAGWCRVVEEACQARQAPRPAALAAPMALAIKKLLGDSKPGWLMAGLEHLRVFRLKEFAPQVAALALEAKQPPAVRSAALEALAACDGAAYLPAATKVIATPREALDLRRRAAQELVGLPDSAEARRVCLAALPAAPIELARPLARCLSRGPEGAAELAKLLGAGKAPKAVLADGAVAGGLVKHGGPAVAKLVETWLTEIPSEDEALAKLLARRRAEFRAAPANAVRGKELFAKHCGICHALGGVGAKVGPQLDGVGGRGFERLLEDTLAPNRNVDAAFRATLLELADGRSFSGFVQREEGAQLVCIDADGKERRFARAELAKRQPTARSPMPSDVAAKLPPDEFRDLLAYLLAQQPQ